MEGAEGAAGTTVVEYPNLIGAATVIRVTAGSSAPATRSVLSIQSSLPVPANDYNSQEKIRLRQASTEVGRKNPSGPRKRANSASDTKVVTVTKVDKFEVEQ